MKEENNYQQKVDEADVTQEVSGSKSATFGLAIDSEGRSNPTHMLPFHVRRTLARWWSNTPAFKSSDAASDFTADDYLSWYEVADPNSADPLAAATVAKELAVSVQEAEDFTNGIIDKDNAFLNYTDVPMCQASVDRLSFWAFNQDAIEFDPSTQFEAQLEAVHALSQLFIECLDFHIHFLSTLDDEYHRQRGAGPLGVMDPETNVDTPWEEMYHWWRNEVKRAYLDSGLVKLPTGLENSNWTINDVLTEVMRLMLDSNGQLLPEFVVSEKGFVKAKSGISLGIYSDPGMTDSDGNPRFYQPAWRTGYVDAAITTKTPDSVVRDVALMFPGVDRDANGDPTEVAQFSYQRGGSSAATASGLELASFSQSVYMDTQHTSFSDTLDLVARMGRLPKWARDDENDLSTISTEILETNSSLTLTQGRPDGYLRSLPGPDGLLSGSFYYWRGHQLNLAELIQVMRRMGRVLEPEVARGFLPAMGIVNSLEAMMAQPSGMSARMYDDLINAYTSSFAYNENPARKYTAAHLGPLDRGIARGELSVGDNLLYTETTDADGNVIVPSVREEFWTPGALETEADLANVFSYFLPGAKLDMPMLGQLAFTDATAPILAHMDKKLVSRLFGKKGSMLTKVERPVVLPAGVELPEATFASGVGTGGAQLILETIFSAIGGKPFIGLGHNGYIDWRTGSVAEERNLPHYPATRIELAGDEASGTMITQGTGTFTTLPEESYDMTTFAYGSSALISSKIVSLVGVDPVGVAVGRDAIEDEVLELAQLKSTSLWPVGSTQHRTQTGQLVRHYTDTAAVALHNVQASSLPSEISMPMLTWGYDAALNLVNVKPIIDSSTNGTLYSKAPTFLGKPVGCPVDTYSAWAWVPKSFKFTKGSTSVEVNSQYNTGIVNQSVNTVCGPGGLFSSTDSMGREIKSGTWDGRISFFPYASYGPNTGFQVYPAACVTSMETFTQADGNTEQILSTDPADHSQVWHCGQTLLDQILVALNTMSIEDQISILRGTQAFNVEVEMGLMGLWTNWSPTTGEGADMDGDLIAGATWQSLGAGASAPDLSTVFKLSWKNYDKPVPDEFDLDVEFERTNVGGSTVIRDASSRSWSQAYLVPVQDNSELAAELANDIATGNFIWRTGIPMGDQNASEWSEADSLMENHTLVHVAYNPREAPGGSWSRMILDATPSTALRSSGGAFWPMAEHYRVQGPGDYVAYYNQGQSLSLQQSAQATAMLGTYLAEDLSRFWALHGSDMTYRPLDNEYGTTRYWGDTFAGYEGLVNEVNPHVLHVGGVYGRATTAGIYYPQFTSPETTFTATDVNGVVTGNARYKAYTISAGNVSGATYLIPDDPDTRMIYRPYRRLVDAAVSKELKLLMVPTHERYDGAGGPLGLPFYGSPTPFRFAQLALDAKKPDQFILEPGASKSRMIDPKNRGLLTFGKLALLDPNTQRHELLPIVRELNAIHFNRSTVHGSSVGGSYVFERNFIRDVQLGRQMQRMRK